MAPALGADIVNTRKRKRETAGRCEKSLSPGPRARRLLKRGAANGCDAVNGSSARWRGGDVPASSSPSSSSTSSNGKSSNGRRLGSSGEATETNVDDVHVKDTPPSTKTKGRAGPNRSSRGRGNSMPVTEEKRRSLLERNRRGSSAHYGFSDVFRPHVPLAALKCRQRKKQWQQALQETAEKLTCENEQLQEQATKLREDILNLKALLIAQKDCPVAKANGVVDGNVINGTGALPQFPIFPPVTVVRSTPPRRS
ncbi:MAG: hypothetical protein BJ554DRAFT_1124 [Olpidium bornovanus]|uniref:BZIP domain-containing protein n=1 Tax=Olpidium bornovanus TaxID=278681 RepID=A0A8H8DHN0_9FUNG|nr:MAG: hypothetical protein BJ554DRAFT_1124 [Olpidium bornovanus]